MKKLLLILFIITLIAQWAVPAKMIWQKEKVWRSGKLFNFRTEPVDPAHPFKGRYITLNFEASSFTTVHLDTAIGNYDPEVYVLLDVDKDGFAKVHQVVKHKPANTADYVKASINYINRMEHDSAMVMIHYPFAEFYMDEFKAIKAEDVYRESTIDSTQKTYAVVSIMNGDAIVKDVMINNKPIRQVVKEMGNDLKK
ncbi:MAG: GDYXXLXY domain-containing protein [Chitinophagaceae bacterium]|nr:GDYXXLXY domain-containing protein [Chitinophagaceae bacterium]